MALIHRLYRRFVLLIQLPIFLSEFLDPRTGRDYGLGFLDKLALFARMRRNTRNVPSASHVFEHLTMATTLLQIPRDVPGCVVECGTYKGGSATNLSLICRITGRELHVFDSFEGLPKPSEHDRSHLLVDRREIHTYEEGAWAGTMDEVRGNISRHGAIEVCTFHRGYFDRTLPGFSLPVVLAFVDVDLVDSLKPCVHQLWPLLCDGGHLFTHEAPHLEISSLFFDQQWWREALACRAPGLVGAGSGLGLYPGRSLYHSDLGYSVKRPELLKLRVDPQEGMRA